ncbi:hypothetical protein VPHK391_0095 [Vibrio phage K391]
MPTDICNTPTANYEPCITRGFLLSVDLCRC